MQPLVVDEHGVVRFRKNAIIDYMLTAGGRGEKFNLNTLAMRFEFSDEDRMQLAQLIGYSVSGYADLSYVSDESYDKASSAADKLIEKLGVKEKFPYDK